MENYWDILTFSFLLLTWSTSSCPWKKYPTWLANIWNDFQTVNSLAWLKTNSSQFFFCHLSSLVQHVILETLHLMRSTSVHFELILYLEFLLDPLVPPTCERYTLMPDWLAQMQEFIIYKWESSNRGWGQNWVDVVDIVCCSSCLKPYFLYFTRVSKTLHIGIICLGSREAC